MFLPEQTSYCEILICVGFVFMTIKYLGTKGYSLTKNVFMEHGLKIVKGHHQLFFGKLKTPFVIF